MSVHGLTPTSSLSVYVVCFVHIWYTVYITHLCYTCILHNLPCTYFLLFIERTNLMSLCWICLYLILIRFVCACICFMLSIKETQGHAGKRIPRVYMAMIFITVTAVGAGYDGSACHYGDTVHTEDASM